LSMQWLSLGLQESARLSNPEAEAVARMGVIKEGDSQKLDLVSFTLIKDAHKCFCRK